jgi:hypothetical protein
MRHLRDLTIPLPSRSIASNARMPSTITFISGAFSDISCARAIKNRRPHYLRVRGGPARRYGVTTRRIAGNRQLVAHFG